MRTSARISFVIFYQKSMEYGFCYRFRDMVLFSLYQRVTKENTCSRSFFVFSLVTKWLPVQESRSEIFYHYGSAQGTSSQR